MSASLVRSSTTNIYQPLHFMPVLTDIKLKRYDSSCSLYNYWKLKMVNLWLTSFFWGRGGTTKTLHHYSSYSKQPCIKVHTSPFISLHSKCTLPLKHLHYDTQSLSYLHLLFLFFHFLFFFSLSFPTQSVTNTDSALFALAAFPFHVNLTTADSVIDYEPAIKIMLLLGALHNVIRWYLSVQNALQLYIF